MYNDPLFFFIWQMKLIWCTVVFENWAWNLVLCIVWVLFVSRCKSGFKSQHIKAPQICITALRDVLTWSQAFMSFTEPDFTPSQRAKHLDLDLCKLHTKMIFVFLRLPSNFSGMFASRLTPEFISSKHGKDLRVHWVSWKLRSFLSFFFLLYPLLIFFLPFRLLFHPSPPSSSTSPSYFLILLPFLIFYLPLFILLSPSSPSSSFTSLSSSSSSSSKSILLFPATKHGCSLDDAF